LGPHASRSGRRGALEAKASGGGQLLAPNVLGVKHWSRLLGGVLYAASSRVDWASLLRRSFEVDVLARGRRARCPHLRPEPHQT